MWSPHQRIVWSILPAQGPQMYEDIYSAGRHTLWTSFHIKGHKTEEQIMFMQSSHKFWQHSVRYNSYFGLGHQKTFVRWSFFAHQWRVAGGLFWCCIFFELDVYPLWELADGACCTRFCRFSQPQSKLLSTSTQPTPALPYCLATKRLLVSLATAVPCLPKDLPAIFLACTCNCIVEITLSFLEFNATPHSLSSSTQTFCQD